MRARKRHDQKPTGFAYLLLVDITFMHIGVLRLAVHYETHDEFFRLAAFSMNRSALRPFANTFYTPSPHPVAA